MNRVRFLTIALAGSIVIVLFASRASPRPSDSRPAARRHSSTTSSLCQSAASLCADVSNDNPAATYVGHDEPSVALQVRRPRLGQRHHLHDHAPHRADEAPEQQRPGGATWNFQLRPTFWFGLTLCDTESAPEFTKICDAGHRRERPRRHRPGGARLHRQAPRQRVHGAAVLRPGLRAAVRGLRLRRDAVLRGDDDRQPHARPEHRAPRTTPTATTSSSAGRSRSTGPTSRRTATRRRRRTRSSPGRSTPRTSPR